MVASINLKKSSFFWATRYKYFAISKLFILSASKTSCLSDLRYFRVSFSLSHFCSCENKSQWMLSNEVITSVFSPFFTPPLFMCLLNNISIYLFCSCLVIASSTSSGQFMNLLSSGPICRVTIQCFGVFSKRYLSDHIIKSSE